MNSSFCDLVSFNSAWSCSICVSAYCWATELLKIFSSSSLMRSSICFSNAASSASSSISSIFIFGAAGGAVFSTGMLSGAAFTLVVFSVSGTTASGDLSACCSGILGCLGSGLGFGLFTFFVRGADRSTPFHFSSGISSMENMISRAVRPYVFASPGRFMTCASTRSRVVSSGVQSQSTVTAPLVCASSSASRALTSRESSPFRHARRTRPSMVAKSALRSRKRGSAKEW
mmetsp:Transcript_15475/g.24417  ORF Transcript_15475/g.24417 Transcript_15475/m.24417 type:complete len:230 (-) Transcript_15475:771-1460(-)